MITVYGIKYNGTNCAFSSSVISFVEPFIFDKAKPRLTAKSIGKGMIMIKLYRGKKLMSQHIINSNEFDRRYFKLV